MLRLKIGETLTGFCRKVVNVLPNEREESQKISIFSILRIQRIRQPNLAKSGSSKSHFSTPTKASSNDEIKKSFLTLAEISKEISPNLLQNHTERKPERFQITLLPKHQALILRFPEIQKIPTLSSNPFNHKTEKMAINLGFLILHEEIRHAKLKSSPYSLILARKKKKRKRKLNQMEEEEEEIADRDSRKSEEDDEGKGYRYRLGKRIQQPQR